MGKRIFIFLLTLMTIFSGFSVFAEDVEKINFSDFVALCENNEVTSASIYDDFVVLNLKDKNVRFVDNSLEVKSFLSAKNISINTNISESKPTTENVSFLSSSLGFLKSLVQMIFVSLLFFFIFRLIFAIVHKIKLRKIIKRESSSIDKYIRDKIKDEEKSNINFYNNSLNSQPPIDFSGLNMKPKKTSNFSDVSKNEQKPKITLSDVEGLDELKEDIYRIIDYLKNPKKYSDMGARSPKGVILYGPPGTGKTLIAKAIAGEAGVSFFSAVGSDFCEKYVGVGAQRVRELYKKARNSAPCIVFIDEVDAVAGKRDSDSNSEDDRTINALLSELDGFNNSDGIITICATNRLDLLDSAFQRAGRFDLKLAVNLPDAEGREKILKLHAKNKKLAKEINFKELATKTIGFSGADLEALLNESALLAASHNKKEISNTEINDAFFKVVMKGNKKKNKDVKKTKKLIAWHEAGHTLATKLLTDDSVPSVTIVGSTSGAGGVTFRTPKEMTLHSKKYLENLIKVMYAGRAAEEIFLGTKEDITTGASQDIKQATNIIRDYISSYGMGNTGMLDLSQFTRDYESILNEAKDLANKFYEDVLNTLMDNKEILADLANNLYEKETLNEKEIDGIINKFLLQKV